MFDNYTMNGLENLKNVLTFTGTGASLIFGIIGTTFKTHKDVTIVKRGKVIEVNKPTYWLWIAIIGLVISSLITSSALIVDNKMSDIKSEIAAHPLYPFQIQVVIEISPDFDKEEEAAIAGIKKYLVENIKKIKTPTDFEVKSTFGGIEIFCGGNVPFDPSDTTVYDKKIMRLNQYLFAKMIPALDFRLYSSKDDALKKDASVYDFGAGNNRIDGNLINQYYPSSNCKMSYSIAPNNTVTAVYSAPTNYWRTSALINSLYAFKKNGFVMIKLSNNFQKKFALKTLLMYCNGKAELIPVQFSEKDVVSHAGSDKLYKKLLKDILKPELKIRY